MKTLFTFFLALTLAPAIASEYEQQTGYSKSRTCYRSEYREEYIPGTEDDPGYVRSWKETIEVPCNDDVAEGRVIKQTVVEYDDNDCSEGTVAGGLIVGGLSRLALLVVLW